MCIRDRFYIYMEKLQERLARRKPTLRPVETILEPQRAQR